MNHQELWQTVLGEMEIQISKPNFLTWLKQSQLVNRDEKEGLAIVGLPNQFAKEWVKARYHKNILNLLRRSDASIKNIEYIIINQGFETKSAAQKQIKAMRPIDSQSSLIDLKIDPITNLNPNYTIDSFIVGSSNELAFAAAEAIIKDVGTKYNPLFIYGGVGLGKTHLLQGIGNEMKKLYQDRVRISYLPSEKFINDVVWAMRNKRMEDIKKKYRDIDVLIIDDIQFIGGKPATEMEFFHTFNILHQNNKQIIISSDRPPATIPTLEDRLRSRFEGGMVIDISYPDYEMRLAILKAKIQKRGVVVEDKILDFIASKIQKNVRELEGVLNKIIFYQQYKNEVIDLKKIESIINETTKTCAQNITISDVIKTVGDFFEVSIEDLINKGRRQEIVEPRQITMYLLRDMLKMSYPSIGEKLGKRDHTTVIHACEKIEQEMSVNQAINQKILNIKERIFNAKK
ncbi:MAG: chromosomal replication initiator protein DnaA [bacterium]|nr:chromosomal replication initiator protein DnaA [bacterium]